MLIPILDISYSEMCLFSEFLIPVTYGKTVDVFVSEYFSAQ